ncbi:CDP-diacylglycerol--glycerol-3-phosphate 3-phosphatidyltransferase [Verrucomicrobiaceae bacterium R5-34]|uniref:CDP-diacylglycerol--glycerol-3-phosphate 3-phosphatidyltransferase n=1 Tax=Oceaniferula flava TaxID=2800421 RepID=A0AAE2SEV9_9BACT|nr:CDP-diacylglycerol--glycerol-3-phosphate 3-phosphatidyltransferase [Oceaniferula flavus]MBK1831777.1 CDP-diacylglycerol--glycerol-3-phosphate 3-phosphatidyltransferase [Verrucomicrobiaceae bacterium R5-34]MBK1856102.1 CDP-diacylglycerol--glycerol-3-phosphate 3-phosphatidyltransferase [Oceaniferula flavus]MBM1137409.1 CDP-diacylglycerol--glycerol-3-phosphate 3-phosphatidyltransferase [Oceaniferula flavus]
MNLPNTITMFRLVLTAVFCAAASSEGVTGYAIALAAFVLGAISDWLDGYLARKLNLVTSLGKLLDPLADKILVCSGFVYLSAKGLCPVWVTALIICREFLVTGIRQIAVEKGTVIAADGLGKWKTTFQLTFIITALVYLTFETIVSDNAVVTFLQYLSDKDHWLFPLSLWPAVALTVISGVSYFWKSRTMLLDKD